MKLTSWNRIPAIQSPYQWSAPHRFSTLPNSARPFTPFGNGRSYSDVCLHDRGTALTTHQLDHFIAFDPISGILSCESGVTLKSLLELTLPHGWFLPVTPGTRLVTVGGAIANDVHGKNHHQLGSFGCHILKLTLVRSTGERLTCSQTENSELFSATLGGLGLTGLITEATMQLLPVETPWMVTESHRFSHLNDFWPLDQSLANWPYTVAWLDCMAPDYMLGRGIFFAARHATSADIAPPQEPRYREKPFPINPPFSLVNNLSLRLFNQLYYRQPLHPESIAHYRPYFYPLDAIQNWNNLYGQKGFYQYQCVIPATNSVEAIRDLLKTIRQSGEGSFLAVLKTFGSLPSPGLLSFPKEGATLALDFPNRGQRTLKLLEQLDHIVLKAQGRLYPAKDARMSATLFQQGYPQWETFMKYKDPAFSSAFWERVSQ